MSIRAALSKSSSASYWLGKACAYRMASQWITSHPDTRDSFRLLMRQAARFAVDEAKATKARLEAQA